MGIRENDRGGGRQFWWEGEGIVENSNMANRGNNIVVVLMINKEIRKRCALGEGQIAQKCTKIWGGEDKIQMGMEMEKGHNPGK